jgi:predicted TPR repeat methyltransferase
LSTAGAASWDREYAGGRYRHEPPVAFVADILAAARQAGLASGLYIGCGNGRNYEPLVRGGLDLTGLDISDVALRQLSARMPERRGSLVHGDLSALPGQARYGIVVGIQVFQHGDTEAAHAHLRAAQARVASGGLMAVRVNAAGTDIAFAHQVTGRNDDGLTIRYRDGPKAGLEIHFFGEAELRGFFATGFEPVMPLRPQITRRQPPETGQWTQWEGIWRASE